MKEYDDNNEGKTCKIIQYFCRTFNIDTLLKVFDCMNLGEKKTLHLYLKFTNISRSSNRSSLYKCILYLCIYTFLFAFQ